MKTKQQTATEKWTISFFDALKKEFDNEKEFSIEMGNYIMPIRIFNFWYGHIFLSMLLLWYGYYCVV